jgi:hypothetical protein
MLANAEVKVTSSMVPKTATALLQDIELMPQYQDFGFQPPQHADEKEGNCNHATIML